MTKDQPKIGDVDSSYLIVRNIVGLSNFDVSFVSEGLREGSRCYN